MRGIPLFNFPEFDKARDMLRSREIWVTSPADMDREHGFEPTELSRPRNWNQWPDHIDLKDVINRDLTAIGKCDAIFMLDGWENSRGAVAEKAVAEWHRLGVYYQSPSKPDSQVQEEGILTEAAKITSGDRQNQYGPPNQDFRRTAGMWTALFGDMLRLGVKFKPSHVAMAMILLKMSRQLHQKKRDNWVDVAGYSHCGQVCDEAEESG